MNLYDTLERKTKTLQAQDNKSFRFYCCGPTVYGPAHIGNFRTFILQDVLRRTLEVAGMNPYHVRNITDVDDKTIRDSQKANLSLKEFTQNWTKRFHSDCEELNLLKPNEEPKATEHIQEQIDMIATLVEKGHAYAASDGSVYFKVQSFPEYGKLSHLKDREIKTQETTSAGERNDADEYDRESVNDFALWKAHKPDDGENFWGSPWGKGRPGWHIECSAMSKKYLGTTFDLHGGGIDLCFPHHENEIAQSECCTGETFAHHWFHCTHLQVEGEKMSKSLGNLYTLSDLKEKGYSPQTIRYALISGHYKQPLNFTFNGLNAAQSALSKLEKSIANLLARANMTKEDFQQFQATPTPTPESSEFQTAWEALTNDLNTSLTLGAIFSSLKTLESKDLKAQKLSSEINALSSLLYALGIEIFTEEEITIEIPEDIKALAQQRWTAKNEKDWATADKLRDEVTQKGWKIKDEKDGYQIEPIT